MFADGVVVGLSPKWTGCSLQGQGTQNSEGVIMKTGLRRFSGPGHLVCLQTLA